MLIVRTARINYAGPDRLDVTRKSGCRLGATFAPSLAILGPALAARRTGADPWEEYSAAYLAEMRVSYRENRARWRELLDAGERTLCCYCSNPERCHRTLLAGILVKLGATVLGERGGDIPADDVAAWRREGWVENRGVPWVQRRGLWIRCGRCGELVTVVDERHEAAFVESHRACRRTA